MGNTATQDISLDTTQVNTKVFSINLAQASATYDLASCNSIGGVIIQNIQFYVTAAGSLFTSVSVQSNDTTPIIMLSSVEGALANVTAGKNIIKAFTGPTYLHLSKKIQYTLIGVTGTGTMLAIVRYQAAIAGADIS